MEILATNALPLIQNLDARITLISTMDFNVFICPECILCNFMDVLELDDQVEVADRIAQAYQATSGLTIISAETSCVLGRYCTIMDALDEFSYYPRLQLIFQKAFKKNGFKYAKDCDPVLLADLYNKTGTPSFF
jgi:hypothetical protein